MPCVEDVIHTTKNIKIFTRLVYIMICGSCLAVISLLFREAHLSLHIYLLICIGNIFSLIILALLDIKLWRENTEDTLLHQ